LTGRSADQKARAETSRGSDDRRRGNADTAPHAGILARRSSLRCRAEAELATQIV
jgi:isocitrate dehydrogenase